MDNLVSTILIAIVILVVVFLILREVNCWYWKINERITLIKEQNVLLKNIFIQLGGEVKEVDEVETGYLCPNCNSIIDKSFLKCPYCAVKLPKE